MGNTYAVRGKPDARKAAATAKGGNEATGTATAELQPVEQQEAAGNDAAKAMIEKQKADEAAAAEKTKTKTKEEAAPKETGARLPASIRAQLLSDYTISKMAAAVFAEVQDSKGTTEEMKALAVAVWNQSQAVRSSATERDFFKANNMDQLFDNELMYQNYGLDRHLDFHEAVSFGTEFESAERLQTALAVVETVTQVVESGNPLPQDYMVFSHTGVCPTPERVDESTRIQYGGLTFWAFDPAKHPDVVAEEQNKQESTTTLANAQDAIEPPPA